MASIPPTPTNLPRDLHQFLEAMRVAVVGRVSFLESATVSTTALTLVSAQAATRSITAATAQNASAGAVTLNAWILRQGETTSTAFAQLYSGVSVAAGETLALSALVGHVIPPRGSLVFSASAPLAVQVSGVAS